MPEGASAEEMNFWLETGASEAFQRSGDIATFARYPYAHVTFGALSVACALLRAGRPYAVSFRSSKA